MPDIFKYLDFRHFLKDFYQKKKEKKGSSFSFRSFARDAGLSSPNFLKLVMEGKRNLGLKGIVQFAKALRLNKQETTYFENLVHFNQASSDAERNKWYRQLATSKRFREIREIERDHFDYFSHWYCPAIRELVLLDNFKENPEWIANKLRPRITTKQVEETIKLLLRIGFLKRDKQGCLVQSERNITTAREVASLAVANFHRQMIKKAADSIELTLPKKRDISSLTLAISEEKFKEAKRRIQEFRRELNVLLSDDEKSDAVYQINFQIFNLSEVPWPTH